MASEKERREKRQERERERRGKKDKDKKGKGGIEKEGEGTETQASFDTILNNGLASHKRLIYGPSDFFLAIIFHS